MTEPLNVFAGKLNKQKKLYLGATLIYFIGLSIFFVLSQPVTPWGYFYERFLEERYKKSIALLKSHGEQINEFKIMSEAYKDRMSPPINPIGESKAKADESDSDTPRNPTSNVSKGDVGAVCQFNKKVILSYLHREYPQVSWDRIERDYERKMERVGLYRMADWIRLYAFKMILFWFLPGSIGYVVLRKRGALNDARRLK